MLGPPCIPLSRGVYSVFTHISNARSGELSADIRLVDVSDLALQHEHIEQAKTDLRSCNH